MSRFSDDVNRVFDELLRVPWGHPSRPQRHPDPSGEGLVWDVSVPLPAATLDEISVAISGATISVTVGANRRGSADAAGTQVTSESYHERSESFALPAGYAAKGFEARLEDVHLHLRVFLRRRHG